MDMPKEAAKSTLLGYASQLRFPWLLLLTLMLFFADLIVPDLIPFVDEILLGLFALLLAMIKKRRLPVSAPNVIDGRVVAPDEKPAS